LLDDLDKDRAQGTLKSDDSRRKKGQFLYIGSDVGYVITAGMAALSTWYFVRDTLPDSEGRVLEPRDWAFNSSRAHSTVRFDADVARDRVGGHLQVSF
jgi:hypothetical protein